MSAIVLPGLCVVAASVAALTGMLSPSLAGVLAVLAMIGAAVYLGIIAMRDGRTLDMEVEAGNKRARVKIGPGTGRKRPRGAKTTIKSAAESPRVSVAKQAEGTPPQIGPGLVRKSAGPKTASEPTMQAVPDAHPLTREDEADE